MILIYIIFLPKKTILVLGDEFALTWSLKGDFSLTGVHLKNLAKEGQNFQESVKVAKDRKESVLIYFTSRYQLKHLKDLSIGRILDNKIYHYQSLEKEIRDFFQSYLSQGKKILLVTQPIDLNLLKKDCYQGPLPSDFTSIPPSSRIYQKLYLEDKKIEHLILAAQLDCSCEMMEEIFNDIFRKVAKEFQVPVVDFAQFVYDQGSFYDSYYKDLTKQILYFFQ